MRSSAKQRVERGRRRHATGWLALSLLGACSARTVDPPDPRGNGGMSGVGGIVVSGNDAGGAVLGRCNDGSLRCKKVDCPADSVPSTTSVSGHVYDPAGKVPLYNAVVYVAEPDSLKVLGDRALCENCKEFFPETATAVALTKSDGSFRLTDVPVGKDIPLTVQLGKWRRTVPIDVAPCTDTRLPVEVTRLPRNSTEGHLPKIAVTTGGSDALECLLHRIGVDAEEFTPGGGAGRVNLWAGYDAATSMVSRGASVPLPSAMELWADADRMLGYDMILMSCEGSDNLWNQPGDDELPEGVTERRTPAMHLEVRKYADMGGRIFGSHWHHRWINSGDTTPDNDYPHVAAFSKTAGQLPDGVTVQVDTSFPKGLAFRDWLMQVGASTALGELSLVEAEHSVDTVDDSMAQRWIYGVDDDPEGERARDMVQYFSFTTPVGHKECGRMVFSDVHVTFGGGDRGAMPFPTRCDVSPDTALTPQEKALEFMIFDLSSCIQKEDDEVSNPIPVVK